MEGRREGGKEGRMLALRRGEGGFIYMLAGLAEAVWDDGEHGES